MSRSVAATKIRAWRDVDQAAGDARKRYLTDCFGQMDTYRTKLGQAVAYLAARVLDAQAPVPAFIAAEAQALGQANVGTCNKIIAAAAASETVLPQIEAARMSGKEAVKTAAQTVGTDEERIAAIEVARQSAIDTLNLL
jgi:hypothetical protein